ncbi:glycosyltransferase family 39 protein [Engelhardtia mirabilis]|uniref:Uncharacterized protein n=1 Tax=Engelhardtia mirabilis TaxID=2528011 RepID=A0A518BKD3_9BACT|nr:hypothetical protein Pla133_25230 [Planctomycetes bacterium Pla133]QDV01766.1 hypothetical protein Pla86_25220 [Planctomycetes bacterium Pla86]
MPKLRLKPPRDPLALGLGVLALLLGTVRFVKLGEWGLWIDEAFTLADSLHGGGFSNPMGYALYERFLSGLGRRATEFDLRLLPALAGWACIPALWWALRPGFGARASSAAALLLATSSWHLYWSQSARFYTLAMVLSILGVGVAMRAFRRESWVLLLVGIGLAGSAALAHPTAVFVIPGLVVAPLVLRRMGRDCGQALVRTAVAVLVVGALLGTGWGITLIGKWGNIKPDSASPAHLALTTGFYATPLLGAAALAGAALATRRRQAGGLVALSIVVSGLGLALIASLVVRVAAQYVFLLLPWLVTLAVLPLASETERPEGEPDLDEDDEEEEPRWRRRARLDEGRPPARRALLRRPLVATGWVAVLTLPALTNCLLYLGPRHGERPRWKDAYLTVFDQRHVGDLVLGMAAPVGEYYLSPNRTDLRDMREVVYLDKFRANVPVFWDRFARRTWFVVNLEELEEWDSVDRQRMQRILREDCRLVADFPLNVESRDLSVSVYLRD